MVRLKLKKEIQSGKVYLSSKTVFSDTSEVKSNEDKIMIEFFEKFSRWCKDNNVIKINIVKDNYDKDLDCSSFYRIRKNYHIWGYNAVAKFEYVSGFGVENIKLIHG